VYANDVYDFYSFAYLIALDVHVQQSPAITSLAFAITL
jgi:hypothetical protein